MKKDNNKFKNTVNAKEAKKSALKRIIENIKNIYDDSIVREKMEEARWDYYIDEDFYEKYQKEVSKIRSIDKLIRFLKEKWISKITEIGKEAEINNSIAKSNLKMEGQNENEYENIFDSISIEGKDLLKEMIDNLINGNPLLFQRININPDLWRSVIVAILFRVPKEKVIECRESILTKYYLPKINNDHLIIRIHELTEIREIYLIWDMVEKKKKEYKKRHGYINVEKESTSRDTDKKILSYYHQGLSNQEIIEKLESDKITGFDNRKITERIRKRKERIREK